MLFSGFSEMSLELQTQKDSEAANGVVIISASKCIFLVYGGHPYENSYALEKVE